jgi:hypothetical protein
MSHKNRKFPVVDKLPEGAMSVAKYAEQEDFTTSNVYFLFRSGKNVEKGIDIVCFSGINFVVPLVEKKKKLTKG